jgi:hypothetical protein
VEKLKTEEETVSLWTVMQQISYHLKTELPIPRQTFKRHSNASGLLNLLPKDWLIMVIPSETDRGVDFFRQVDHLNVTKDNDCPVKPQTIQTVAQAAPTSIIALQY